MIFFPLLAVTLLKTQATKLPALKTGGQLIVYVDCAATPPAIERALKLGLKDVEKNASALKLTVIRQSPYVFVRRSNYLSMATIDNNLRAMAIFARMAIGKESLRLADLNDRDRDTMTEMFRVSSIADDVGSTGAPNFAIEIMRVDWQVYSDGKRQITVNRSRELSAKPSPGAAASNSNESKAKEATKFDPMERSDVTEFHYFGRASMPEKMRGARIFSERLEKELQIQNEAMEKAYAQAIASMPLYTPPVGSKIDADPQYKDRLDQMKANFKQYGFESEAEASAFFSRATYQSSTPHFMFGANYRGPTGERFEALTDAKLNRFSVRP